MSVADIATVGNANNPFGAELEKSRYKNCTQLRVASDTV